MIRDPGPIHNIGHSVTSRDVPTTGEETDGISPNSGIISRAVSGNPIVGFLASSAVTMTAAFVASKLVKSGGLRLAKGIQDQASANPGGYATSIVKNVTDLRRHLDELQGLTRHGGDRAYSDLVWEQDGRLTTGIDLDGRLQEVNGLGFLTAEERAKMRQGVLQEPATVWSFRDTLQQKMVRAGRRLPYELPAFYVAQRAITDPLFGNKSVDENKVNWHNPIDVITDFTKESITAAATMILPFEFAGAAASQSRSSLHTIRHSKRNLDMLSPIEQKMHRGFTELDELLKAVGNDFASVQGKFLRTHAQASGAFSAVADPYRNKQGFVQNLHSLRHGRQRAIESIEARRKQGEIVRDFRFTDLFSSKKMADYGQESVVKDLIPGFAGLSDVRKQFLTEWRLTGDAFDVLRNAKAFDDVALAHKVDSDHLSGVMQKIAGMSNSRILKAAEEIGGGTPGFFMTGRQNDAFKGLLVTRLKAQGMEKGADDFVNNLRINNLPFVADFDPTKIVSIGRVSNYGIPGSGNFRSNESYFENILQRYKGVSKDSEVASAITSGQLEKAVKQAGEDFINQRRSIRHNIHKQWGSIQENHIGQIGVQLAGKQKLSYLSFKNENLENTQALARQVANVLGIKSTNTNSMRSALASRGIDPDNFTEMRSFLLRNRKMSSNLFGSRDLGLMQVRISDIVTRDKQGKITGTYDDLDAGMKKIVSENQFKGLQAMAGGSKSAMESSIDNVAIAGLYKNARTSGVEYLNYGGVKSTLSNVANFFMDEFKIPILGFNPFDLFGKSSFNAIANSSPIQYMSGRSVQPFVQGMSPDDFGIFLKTGRTKGRLIKGTDAGQGVVNTEMLEGYFRPLQTNSDQLLSRYARASAGVSGQSPYDIRASLEGRGLTRTERIKKAFDVDIEQKDSRLRFISRFRGRHFDLQNPTTLTKLLGGDEIVRYSGGRKQTLKGRVSGGTLQVVDADTQQVVRTLSEQDVFKGLDLIRRQSNQLGVSQSVIDEFGQRIGFTATGRQIPGAADGVKLGALSSIRTPQQLMQYVEDLVSVERDIFENLLPDQQEMILRSQQKLRSMVGGRDLSALSPKSSTSPTITTVSDDIKTAIFKHQLSTEAVLRSSADPDPFMQVSRLIDDMVGAGKISSAQRAESKASIFSALQDSAAFKTFSMQNSQVEDASNAFYKLLENKDAFKAFSEPYANGSLGGALGGPIRKKLSPISSGLLKGRFVTSRSSLEDFSIDPLGSGQPTTFVPTFGSVFGRDPMGATLSALGITTYKNPSTYSNASAAMAHAVGRLDSYFGAVGLGLGGGNYSGPLSEFAIGMVGKRVLPAYIAGQTFVTADRTAGGLVNERDADGNRVYSPLVMGTAAKGAVEAQSILSGMVPGGYSYQERKDELTEGEVAIRQGRYWPLGVTPFKGGKIQYYRPSYYRRLQAGALYTDDTYGSPLEKFLFYTDVSPLRPLDPYRFERKHYEDRPYPVTGEYFTGPFGPLTALGNMTIGKILKPRRMMHEQELQAGLANYMPAGQFGAYDASAYIGGGAPSREQPTAPGPSPYGAMGVSLPGTLPGGFSQVAGYNAELASRAGPTGMASGMVRGDIGFVNQNFASMAYAPPKATGVMTPGIIPSGPPISQSSLQYQMGEFGYFSQEMAGIYGFAAANVRETLGFGQGDLTPQRSVLQSAGRAYGSSRAFWDLNLGGLGDIPTPSEGIGNLEFSEVVRRFIPRQRSDVDFINPIANTMGQRYPFLPGAEYFTNFQTGDPYTKIQEGEIRLPGIGYERLNRLYGDISGEYGAVTQLDILGDVAPYSKQYRNLDRQINNLPLSPDERIKVQEIRDQVNSRVNGDQFSEYKYKGSSARELGISSNAFRVGRLGEAIAHSDNFLVNKVIGDKTAVEDWERKNVYGSTFPEWQNPISSFISPMMYKATQDNPLAASSGLAVLGTFFGRTPRAKAFGAAVGALSGASASIYGQATEALTGERFIPQSRKKELALEEYVDILSYVKNSRLANMAQRSGDFSSAVEFRRQAQSTMYGADLQNMNTQMLQYAIPSRKRQHFQKMIEETDQGERERILSTAGRLERRIYQAAWGMNVEKRPELDEYFERHELPDENWEGWHPNTNMEHIKIKMGQSMGLEMSQMGYYPQQVKQANLSNPAYPSFFADEKSEDMFLRLKSLMSGTGVSGTVIPVPNTFGRQDINVSYGVNYG